MIALVLATIDAVAATTPPAWEAAASVAAGSLVGLSLGLTGGGGAIFAVPLLVYWIGVDPRTAVSISLVTVAATALVGAIERWWYGQVELRTGLLFAAAGMLTAPAGGWLGSHVPPQMLMAAFAGLMLLIAAVFSLVGVMHSPLPDERVAWPWHAISEVPQAYKEVVKYQTPWHWSGAYLVSAVMLLALGRDERNCQDPGMPSG